MKAEPSEAVTADPPKAPDATAVNRPALPPTPLTWRLGLAAVIVVVALAAYVAQPVIGTRPGGGGRVLLLRAGGGLLHQPAVGQLAHHRVGCRAAAAAGRAGA